MGTRNRSLWSVNAWTEVLAPGKVSELPFGTVQPHSVHDVMGAGRAEAPRRPNVMVADGHPVNLRRAFALLSFWDIVPVLAANGAEAVSLACRTRFDLILMDLCMPVLDGVAATARIRRFERQHAQSRSQIVALTSEDVSWKALRAHGMDAIMFKPCDAMDIQECIQRCCPGIVLR